MKILLTEPISNFIPVRLGFYCPHNGILSIASFLEKWGYDVKVVEPWIFRFNLNKLVNYIKCESPDVVGITSTTCTAYHAMVLAKLVKEISPKTIVIVGGHHFSFAYLESLEICEDIDYIIIGEGEHSFLDLVNSLKSGKRKIDMKDIPGLAFKLEKKIIKTPPRLCIEDLDEMPLPAYHFLFFKDKVKAPLARGGTIGCVFSRGCSNKCTFCSESLLWQYKNRCRGAENILEEIRLLVGRYKIFEFTFEDADFLCNRERNLRFLELLGKEHFRIKFRFATRVDILIENRDILYDFRKLGLISVVVGIESFSQKCLDKWDKKTQVEQIFLAAKYIKKAKIPVFEGLTIIGSYNESKENINKILMKAEKVKVNTLWSTILTPFPGTPLYKTGIKEKTIKIYDYRKYNMYNAVMELYKISLNKIEIYNILIHMKWFYNPVRWAKSLFNPQWRKFQFFQLFFDFKIIVRILFFVGDKANKRSGRYQSLIRYFHYRHLNFLNKSNKSFRSIKVWRD